VSDAGEVQRKPAALRQAELAAGQACTYAIYALLSSGLGILLGTVALLPDRLA
jgi:hypothetical protein